MSALLAYFNGDFRPAAEIGLPVTDAGFVQGVAVSEQMRTFGGRLFELERHLSRLRHSLEIIDVRLPVGWDELRAIAERLAAHNHGLLDSRDDLGLSLFVTPGPYPSFTAGGGGGPTLGLHTYPLPFRLWAGKYAQGERLRVPDVRQVPANCWPPELKCRSRMHYYLADQQAGRREPGVRALLLDQQGFVTEASTANVFACRVDEGLLSPRQEKILPGVSAAVVSELARTLEVPVVYRDLMVDDLLEADEVLLCSTSPCLLPVVALDGRPIGTGRPGPVFERLLALWSETVQVDIHAQALGFAERRAEGSAG